MRDGQGRLPSPAIWASHDHAPGTGRAARSAEPTRLTLGPSVPAAAGTGLLGGTGGSQSAGLGLDLYGSNERKPVSPALGGAEPFLKSKIDALALLERSVPRTIKVTRSGNVVDVMVSLARLRREPADVSDDVLSEVPFSVTDGFVDEPCPLGSHAVDSSEKPDLPEKSDSSEKPEKPEKRIANPVELRRTFSRLRQLINANSSNPRIVKWVTLTFRPNEDGSPMTDNVYLLEEMRRYHARLRRYARDRLKTTAPEYIDVVEPQGSGAWHIHEIQLWTGLERAPFIEEDVFKGIWRAGFFNVKNVRRVDNLGAYLSAYLADDLVDVLDDDGNPVFDADGKPSKKVIKGGRLHFYPANMKIYRHSRGVKMPEVEYISALSLASLMRELGLPDWSSGVSIDTPDWCNQYGYFQWTVTRDHKPCELSFAVERGKKDSVPVSVITGQHDRTSKLAGSRAYPNPSNTVFRLCDGVYFDSLYDCVMEPMLCFDPLLDCSVDGDPLTECEFLYLSRMDLP